MKKLLVSFLMLCTATAFGQYQSEYSYVHPFMSDMALLKKNKVLEITTTSLDKDLEGGQSLKEIIHYVFDEEGRLMMEFRGETFANGVLHQGDYALKFEYAFASNLPYKITVFTNEAGEVKSYEQMYEYNAQGQLVAFNSSQDNTEKKFSYKNGKLDGYVVTSQLDYLNDKVNYKYPNATTREEYGWGMDPNDTSDDPKEKFVHRLTEKLNAKGLVLEAIYNPTIGAQNIVQYTYVGNALTKVVSKLNDGSIADNCVNTFNAVGLQTQQKWTWFQMYSTDKTREMTTTFKYDYR